MLSHQEWRAALDRVADAYDRFRPGYPAEIAGDVAALAQLSSDARILEIGCGTGQLTRQFAERGYSMVALEPGASLAARTRANFAAHPRVRVEVTTLEDWVAPEGPPFDLILSAQSFHLVDGARRFPLAAGHLGANGSLAVVWSYRLPGESAAHRAVQAAYAKHAPPDLRPDQAWQDGPFEDEIDRSGLFGSVFMRKYLWTHVYDTEHYVGLLGSQATHETLPPPIRQALLDAVGEGVERSGGKIEIGFVTRLYVAGRRP